MPVGPWTSLKDFALRRRSAAEVFAAPEVESVFLEASDGSWPDEAGAYDYYEYD